MIRGIPKKQIVEDFLADKNAVDYAKYYGIEEVIDGFLITTYEGFFNEEEQLEIINCYIVLYKG